MTKEAKLDCAEPKSAKRKGYRLGWIGGATALLAGLSALIAQNTPANDRGVIRGFESRYDQERTANINCAGKWGEERKACHALFGN